MSKRLSYREYKFVMCFLGNATEAARLAGYADKSYGSLKVQACRLLKRQRVVEAIQTRNKKELTWGPEPNKPKPQCGARAKSTGQPCKQYAIFPNGRCKFHGGMSTGPKSAAGKRKSSQNARKKKVHGV